MSRNVLIVDDERHITHILGYKVKQAGFNVMTAGDGEEGYSIACDQLPDLIVTDFQMPYLDGHSMCVKLRENGPTSEIPVILLTARGHLLTPSELTQTNIQELLQKPFSAHELLARITELLEAKDDTDIDEQDAA